MRALVVYNSNPVAVAPDSRRVAQGFAREDLFTVVLEHFQTDTADYADILLPATTQLEHLDVVKPYGHYYLVANNPAISPLGEAKPNTEVFRLLARAMGFTEPCFEESDRDDRAVPRWPRIGISTRYAKHGWKRFGAPRGTRALRKADSPLPRAKWSSVRRPRSRSGSIRCPITSRRSRIPAAISHADFRSR